MSLLPYYSTIIGKNNLQDIQDWCTDCFGPCGGVLGNKDGNWQVWGTNEKFDNTFVFYFKNKDDFILFKMRWL